LFPEEFENTKGIIGIWNRRSSDNTMAKRKRTKGTKNDLHIVVFICKNVIVPYICRLCRDYLAATGVKLIVGNHIVTRM